MSEPLLRVSGLRVCFRPSVGPPVAAVDGVDFRLEGGQALGIVGESGCGKTLTCLAILRLIDPPGYIEPGSSVRFRGDELTSASPQRLRAIRGAEIGMIFQEPATSLNPVFTCGDQIAEAVRLHRGADSSAARARARELLERVGIPDPERRLDEYPHQLSGGMRQRVMIAMALACEPSLLIADEPTTALDVTLQAELLELLDRLRRELGMALILVSHDLGVVAGIADRVLVMYAGQVVESGATAEVLQRPRHPYTEGLLRAIPQLDRPASPLPVIPGSVPDPSRWPDGCRFHPRCAHAWERCRDHAPPLMDAEGGRRSSRCWLEEEPARGR